MTVLTKTYKSHYALLFAILLCAPAVQAKGWFNIKAPSIKLSGLNPFKSEGVHVIITDPFVDVRTGPGRGFPVFHVIEKGEQVHIYKRRNNWYKLKTNKDIVGWVKRDQLNNTLSPDGNQIDFSTPGQQDYISRRFEMGMLGGQFEGVDAYTTYLGYHLTQNISTELRYTETFSQIANNKMITLAALHQPFPSWRISPFFTLGAGEIKIAPSSDLVQSEERENPVLTVGGGAFIYVSRRFLMRVEYNNHTLLTQRENNEEVEEWKIGFSVFF